MIGEERARELNSPQGRLDQTHLALTYLRHPYRNPILGWPEDIARIGADDLRAFYQAHYRPDGAVLVVVGDVDPEAALDRISSHFADVPAGDSPSPATRDRRAEPVRPARFRRSPESESAARSLLGWRTVPRAIATLRSWMCSPISSVAAADRVSGTHWSRPTRRPPGSRPLTRRRTGPASFLSSSRPRRAPTSPPSSRGSRPSYFACAKPARRPLSSTDHGAGSKRPGAGNRKT